MDPEIKMQKYFSNLILSGLYKAIVYLQIVKARVHLLLGHTWFLSGAWIQKLKWKNMFLTGSYPVSLRALSTCKFLRQIIFASLPYLVPIWHMDPEIKMQKYVSNRILFGFYKAIVYLQIVMPN